MVASRRSSGWMRHVHPREGRKDCEGGGRPEPSDHAGPSVPEMHRARRGRLPQGPPAEPHEACPRGSRQGCMGEDFLGRGLRFARGEDPWFSGKLRCRVHLHADGHGSRVHALRPGVRPCYHEHAERCIDLPVLGRGVLRPARDHRELPPGRRRAGNRLCAVLPRSLRRSALGLPEVHHGVGQGPALLEPRRLLRPQHHRHHEARREDHHRGPALDLARCALGVSPAAAPRHRCCCRHGLFERHHLRGPLRSRFR